MGRTLTKPSKTHRDNAGFTLIEILITLSLAGIVYGGFALCYLASSTANDDTLVDSQATHALRSVAETIRGTNFTDIHRVFAGQTLPVDVLNGRVTVTCFTNEADSSAEAVSLGLPRDLDGDGNADNGDVSTSYVLLPVMLELTYPGRVSDVTRNLGFLIAAP